MIKEQITIADFPALHCTKPTVMGSTATIREIEGINRVHHLNFLNNTLPDKCANLIIADPPYFEVKGAFDFVWEDMKAYLLDVEKWAKECKRLLADNGTLFWFGDAKNIAYAQVIFDLHFTLLNSIVWENTNDHKQQIRFNEGLRTFAPLTERILMYGSKAHDVTGLAAVEKEFVAPRNPFAIELKKARIAKGVSINQVAEYGKFYGNVNHGGAVTNWERGYNVPLPEQWEILCNNLPIERKEYDELRIEYEMIRAEYEAKRRSFENFRSFGDVIRLPNYQTCNHDHDTVKPEELARTLIMTCSRKDDLVIVPFSGSGTECAMSVKEGRRAIGFDIEEKYCKMSNRRVQDILRKPELFQ